MIMIPEYNNSSSDNSTTNSIFLKCGIPSPALTTYIQGISGTVLLPYMVVCLPANLWVMWLISHGTKDSLAAELFHLNMAICETIYLLGSPLQLYCLFDPAGGGPAVQILVIELVVLLWFGRPLFQCSICVERYLAVVHPLTFIRFKPLRFRVLCSGLMWFAISVNLSSNWKTDPRSLLITTLSFFMTLSVNMFCCLSVLWSLKQPGPAETERTGGNNMKRRAFNIISLNLWILLVTYLPTLVVLSLKGTFSQDIFLYLYYPAIGLTVLGGIAQPLLYLYKAGKLPRTWVFMAMQP